MYETESRKVLPNFGSLLRGKVKRWQGVMLSKRGLIVGDRMDFMVDFFGVLCLWKSMLALSCGKETEQWRDDVERENRLKRA